MRTLKNRWRRRRLARSGIDVEHQCDTIKVGEGPGSWTLCPSGLGKESVVYSFGVGTDVSFDLDLINRFGVTVHAFDPTPASVAWVREQPLPAEFVFHATGIADFDGELKFNAPRKEASAHYTPVKRYRKSSGDTVPAQVKRLRTLMNEIGHDHIDLLKLDIEGGEYGVIADLASDPVPVGQLLVEFHHNYPTIPYRQTLAALSSLRSLGFRVVAISERTYELSLVHRDILVGLYTAHS